MYILCFVWVTLFTSVILHESKQNKSIFDEFSLLVRQTQHDKRVDLINRMIFNVTKNWQRQNKSIRENVTEIVQVRFLKFFLNFLYSNS